MTHFVFVFGTLKEGFPNFATNKGTRVPGSFVTTECYPLYLVGERHSPWLINMPGEGERVYGQVFQVDDDTLAAMDKLERIHEPDGYRRVLLEVQSNDTPDSSALGVFAYLKQPHHFLASEARVGPLSEYTLEHAALYRPRA
jgi:gamma-glutamylaminecyclotransferase